MSIRTSLMVCGVAVATIGLSTCKDGGAVDPAPGPLDCAALGKGETLVATGALVGQELTVTITTGADGSWKAAPQITAVTGATLGSVTVDSGTYQATVVLTLDAGATSGAFTLTGTLVGYENDECAVTRTFHFEPGDGGGVTVAQRDGRLPLGGRERAAIVVTRRDGLSVDLHAAGVVTGAAVGWTATGGAVDARGHDRITWRLPEAPGLYQIELLVDRGRDGLSVDTLTLEVG
jgi:hypothetical protein